MLSRVAGLLLCMGGILAGQAGAEKMSPADRMAAVVEQNSLDGASMKPWDLLLKFQLYDEQGQPGVEGTIEEQWAAPDRWRIEFTEGARKDVLLNDGGAFFHSAGAAFPGDAESLLEEITHAVPAEELQNGQPEIREQTFGALKTDCIVLAQRFPHAELAPLGLFPTYCVQDDNLVRVNYLSPVTTITANQIGVFQGHRVATQVTMMTQKTKVGEARVEKLSDVDAGTLTFSHDGMSPGRVWTARVSSGVMKGLVLKKVPVTYPDAAKRGHIFGTVNMRASIGGDGQVRMLHVFQAPDVSLAVAAVVAGLQWTYRPYIMNGVPTDVQTTLTVNFHLM